MSLVMAASYTSSYLETKASRLLTRHRTVARYNLQRLVSCNPTLNTPPRHNVGNFSLYLPCPELRVSKPNFYVRQRVNTVSYALNCTKCVICVSLIPIHVAIAYSV